MVDFATRLDQRRRAKLDVPADLALGGSETHEVHVPVLGTVQSTPPAQAETQPPRRPCGCAETERLCLHGIQEAISDVAGPADDWRQPRSQVIDPSELTSPLDSLPSPAMHPVDLWPTPAPLFTYLAGAAGSGKTFAVKDWASREPGLLLCATTGIAAINLGGTTINAQLGYFDTKSLQESYTNGFLTAKLGKLWKAGVRRIVLDEVSMLDGDQLTYLVKGIEEVNGRGYVLDGRDAANGITADGGGLGLTLVGDFAQLPPVKAPFAFESSEWSRFAEDGNTITLTEIRRQADPQFIEALRAARRGDGRKALDYFGPTLHTETDDQFEGPTLLAKNEAVDRYNWIRMNRLTGSDVHFPSARDGKQRSEWGNPDKPPNTWGIPQRLHLKIGALVMILANKRKEKGGSFLYVNGDLGELVEADEAAHTAQVRLQRTGEIVTVDYVRREVLIPLDSARRTELRALGQDDKIAEGGKWEIAGWISYLPLRVAYASTVHKCVSADTRIRVGSAIVPMGTLTVGDSLFIGGEALAVAATARPAFRLTTQRGYTIVASADHRWLSSTGWVSTTEIAAHLGHVEIAVNRGPSQHYQTYPYAWWLGALVGNGTYTDKREGQLHFATTHEVLGNQWGSITLSLGAAKASWRKDRRGLHTTCKALRARLLADGLDYVKGPDKRIPWVVWSEGPSAWASFIRGLFDTDGSVGKSHVVYATSSEGLSIDVQDMLLELGVVSRRSRYKGQKAPYWQVYVTAESLDAFRPIGFSHPEKAIKLALLHPNRVIRRFTGFDTVASVEDLGETLPMVDVEVGAPHIIGTGPFLSHNSQGLSLDRVQVTIRDAFFKSPGMLYVSLSRARTAAGLRLVGSEAAFVERCTADPKILSWL